ncbi:MAG: hypothetical protein PHQ23_10345 [Candidatus Wallbacteria bacterium]|nr:hypothetical protein [Candidatus Wallbacteria bacterium]
MQLIRQEYLSWLSSKDSTEPAVSTGYQPKIGDVVMFRGNVFLAIVEAAATVKAFPATPYHSLCTEQCLVLDTDCDLTGAWGILPKLLEVDQAVIKCCEPVDSVNAVDLKLLLEAMKSSKPLPQKKRGLTYEDKTAYPYLFLAYEIQRVEHELRDECFIDASAFYAGEAKTGVFFPALAGVSIAALKAGTSMLAKAGPGSDMFNAFGAGGSFKLTPSGSNISIRWDSRSRLLRIETAGELPDQACEIRLLKRVIYRGPVRRLYLIGLSRLEGLLCMVVNPAHLVGIRIFPGERNR